MRANSKLFKDGMIGTDGIHRADLAVDDQPEKLNKGKLVLGVIDFTAVECDLCPVFLGIVQELKGVAGRAGRAAEDAHDQVGVEPDEFFESGGPVVHDLQEERPTGWGHAGQHPRDHVVLEMRQDLGGDDIRDIGVEDFEKVAKPLTLGFLAKLVKSDQRCLVMIEVVIESDAVKTQIGASLRSSGAQSRWPHWAWSMLIERNGRLGSLA